MKWLLFLIISTTFIAFFPKEWAGNKAVLSMTIQEYQIYKAIIGTGFFLLSSCLIIRDDILEKIEALHK